MSPCLSGFDLRVGFRLVRLKLSPGLPKVWNRESLSRAIIEFAKSMQPPN